MKELKPIDIFGYNAEELMSGGKRVPKKWKNAL